MRNQRSQKKKEEEEEEGEEMEDEAVVAKRFQNGTKVNGLKKK